MFQVDPCDDFPKTSCFDCAKNVKMALKIRKQIIQSHKTLLEEFLAKCRESNVFESEVDKNKSSVPQKTDKLDETLKIVTAPTTRRAMRSRLKPTKAIETKVETSEVMFKASSNLKEENVNQDSSRVDPPQVENLVKDIKEPLSMSYNPHDSNSNDPPSPMSDLASDVGNYKYKNYVNR